jgi:putative transposase
MKKTRFTEEQMVTILREADERPVPEVAKRHGVSAQTIYGWRKHFGTLEPADVKRLRQLEQENGRLKKMVADRELEIDVLKEITRKKCRRTCAPSAGRVYPIARPVWPPGVRLVGRGAVMRGLRLAAAAAGRARSAGDARLGGPVSALWLSEDSHLSGAAGACDEHRSDVPALAPGRASGTEAPTAATCRDRAATSAAAERRQSRVGL